MSNLTPDWSTVELRRAARAAADSFIDGDWIEAPYITNQGIRLIQTGNIGRGSFLDKADTQKYISRASFRLLNCKWVNSGDLLICRLADPIGRSCEIPVSVGEAVTSVDCTIFRVDPSRFDKRFVLHWLNSAENLKNASDKAAGSTRSRISRSNLGKLPIPEPNLNEQGLIAHGLDTLDTAIHETEAIIDKLKAVKQGLLHDLLTRGVDDTGELRPPQTEAPHLYKHSPFGWIPKEWELSTVGEQFEIQLGKMLDVQKNVGVLKPYLGNKAVQWDRIDLGGVQQVRLSKSDLIRFRLQKGDLLVCEGGDVGRAAIWEDDLHECYYQKALHRLRSLRGYHPRLMLETLRYLMGRDALSEYVSRTSIAHLTQEKLAAVPLPTPRVDEQERMVAEILSIKQRLEGEESQLQKLKLLKSGLMDDLLTGRVRVKSLLLNNGGVDG